MVNCDCFEVPIVIVLLCMVIMVILNNKNPPIFHIFDDYLASFDTVTFP